MLKNIQTNSIFQVHAILKALPAHLQQMQEKKDKEKEKDKDTEKEKPNWTRRYATTLLTQFSLLD